MNPLRPLITAVALAALAAGCVTIPGASTTTVAGDRNQTGSGTFDAGDCTAVQMAVSSEKIAVLTELSAQFNSSKQAKVGKTCVKVNVTKKSSGGAATRRGR